MRWPWATRFFHYCCTTLSHFPPFSKIWVHSCCMCVPCPIVTRATVSMGLATGNNGWRRELLHKNDFFGLSQGGTRTTGQGGEGGWERIITRWKRPCYPFLSSVLDQPHDHSDSFKRMRCSLLLLLLLLLLLHQNSTQEEDKASNLLMMIPFHINHPYGKHY